MLCLCEAFSNLYFKMREIDNFSQYELLLWLIEVEIFPYTYK